MRNMSLETYMQLLKDCSKPSGAPPLASPPLASPSESGLRAADALKRPAGWDRLKRFKYPIPSPKGYNSVLAVSRIISAPGDTRELLSGLR